MGKSKTWYFSEVNCHATHNQNKSTSSKETAVCYDISWTDILFLIVFSAVVVFAFILCWLPFHVGRYLFSKSFEPGSVEIAQISQYCNLVSFVLFYLSAAINPILYNILSKKYRVAVFKLLGFEPFSQRKLTKQVLKVVNTIFHGQLLSQVGVCSEQPWLPTTLERGWCSSRLPVSAFPKLLA